MEDGGFFGTYSFSFSRISDEIRNFQDCKSLKIPVFVCFFLSSRLKFCRSETDITLNDGEEIIR